MRFRIKFLEGQLFSGLTVLPPLKALAHKVENILARFDEAYPSLLHHNISRRMLGASASVHYQCSKLDF